MVLRGTPVFSSEVNVINKQKFLAELAKLLTFMYEDDRQSALSAYADMFDEAADEQALIQALNSPLRQAVEVARAYNAGTPSLGSPSRANEGVDDEAFLDAIEAIRVQALSLQPSAHPIEAEPEAEVAVNDDQISLFDESQTQPEEAAAPETAYLDAEPFADAFLDEAPAESRSDEAVAAPEAADEPAPEQSLYADEEEVEEEDDEDEGDEEDDEEDVSVFDDEENERLPVQKTVRKARVLLLIPYVILAIPITLALLLLLLVPALASLAVAAACLATAVIAVLSSLGAFPKIASLLVAIGAAVIVFALGILFFMLSIWFFVGAMGGVVRGVIALGGKWCYKEVEAE